MVGVGGNNQWKSDVFKFILICNCLLYPQIYTGTTLEDVWHRTPTLGPFLQEPQGLPPPIVLWSDPGEGSRLSTALLTVCQALHTSPQVSLLTFGCMNTVCVRV